MQGAIWLELCREFHALAKDTGVVVLSVRDSEKDTIQALEAGADEYISKPFRLRELVARCRALSRRVRTGQDSELGAIQMGDLVLDLGRRILRKAGKVIRLTPTEYDLLVFFYETSRLAVETRSTAQRHLGGAQCREDVEYLRIYVRQLRQKIEEDPADPKYLVTERGLGYRFCTSMESSSSAKQWEAERSAPDRPASRRAYHPSAYVESMPMSELWAWHQQHG